MIENIKTLLFDIENNVAVETNNNSNNNETCVEVSLNTIWKTFSLECHCLQLQATRPTWLHYIVWQEKWFHLQHHIQQA